MKYPSPSERHTPGVASISSDVEFSITLSILPISIRHTSTHVVFSPGWIPDAGDESAEIYLTDKTCRSSAFITSHTMLGRKKPEITTEGARSRKSILYFIVIELAISTGLPGPMGGIGVQKHVLSQLTPMPDFWKPGFSITIEVVHSGGYTMSLINV